MVSTENTVMSIDEQLYKTVMESQATDSSVNRND